jgi:hypothetical protein
MAIIMGHQTEERELVARDVRPDERHRVSLGAALRDGQSATSYDVYRDKRGRIILEPKVSIPASEAWLFHNKAALESVVRGLKQIDEAKVIGSFAKHAEDDES